MSRRTEAANELSDNRNGLRMNLFRARKRGGSEHASRPRLSRAHQRVLALMLSCVASIMLLWGSTGVAQAQTPSSTDYSLYKMSSSVATVFGNSISPDSTKVLDKQWIAGLYDRSSGGNFLGYPDKIKNQNLTNWFTSQVSASSTSYGYSALNARNMDSLNKAYGDVNAMLDYAHYGALLRQMGFDSTGSKMDGFEGIARQAMGMTIKVLYMAAGTVPLVFGAFFNFLKSINPFSWFYDGILQGSKLPTGDGNSGSSIFASGVGPTSNPALAGVATVVSDLYRNVQALGWVLVPIFFGTLIFSLIALNRANRTTRIKAFVVRLLFIGLGIPLLGSFYTGTLNWVSEGVSGGNVSANKAVLSNYVDTENWVRATRLAIPSGVTLVWDNAQKGPDVKTQASLRTSAMKVNESTGLYGHVVTDFGSDGNDVANWNKTITDSGSATTAESTEVTQNVNSLLDRYINGAQFTSSAYENSIKSNLSALGKNDEVKKWFDGFTSDDASTATGAETNPLLLTAPKTGLTVSTKVTESPDIYYSTFTTQGVEGVKGMGKLSEACGLRVVTSDMKPIACGMSPLSMFNYLNSSFGTDSMTVYSSSTAPSEFTRQVHQSVSSVGTGVMGTLYWLNTAVLLLAFAVIGWAYAVSMVISNLKRGLNVVLATPMAMIGVIPMIGRIVVQTVALVTELIGTAVMYLVVTELLMGFTSALQAPMALVFGGSGSTQNVVAQTIVSSGLGSMVLIAISIASIAAFTVMALRFRKQFLGAVDEITTKFISQFLGVGLAPAGLGQGSGLGQVMGRGAGEALGLLGASKLGDSFNNLTQHAPTDLALSTDNDNKSENREGDENSTDEEHRSIGGGLFSEGDHEEDVFDESQLDQDGNIISSQANLSDRQMADMVREGGLLTAAGATGAGMSTLAQSGDTVLDSSSHVDDRDVEVDENGQPIINEEPKNPSGIVIDPRTGGYTMNGMRYDAQGREIGPVENAKLVSLPRDIAGYDEQGNIVRSLATGIDDQGRIVHGSLTPVTDGEIVGHTQDGQPIYRQRVDSVMPMTADRELVAGHDGHGLPVVADAVGLDRDGSVVMGSTQPLADGQLVGHTADGRAIYASQQFIDADGEPQNAVRSTQRELGLAQAPLSVPVGHDDAQVAVVGSHQGVDESGRAVVGSIQELADGIRVGETAEGQALYASSKELALGLAAAQQVATRGATLPQQLQAAEAVGGVAAATALGATVAQKLDQAVTPEHQLSAAPFVQMGRDTVGRSLTANAEGIDQQGNRVLGSLTKGHDMEVVGTTADKMPVYAPSAAVAQGLAAAHEAAQKGASLPQQIQAAQKVGGETAASLMTHAVASAGEVMAHNTVAQAIGETAKEATVGGLAGQAMASARGIGSAVNLAASTPVGFTREGSAVFADTLGTNTKTGKAVLGSLTPMAQAVQVGVTGAGQAIYASSPALAQGLAAASTAVAQGAALPAQMQAAQAAGGVLAAGALASTASKVATGVIKAAPVSVPAHSAAVPMVVGSVGSTPVVASVVGTTRSGAEIMGSTTPVANGVRVGTSATGQPLYAASMEVAKGAVVAHQLQSQGATPQAVAQGVFKAGGTEAVMALAMGAQAAQQVAVKEMAQTDPQKVTQLNRVVTGVNDQQKTVRGRLVPMPGSVLVGRTEKGEPLYSLGFAEKLTQTTSKIDEVKQVMDEAREQAERPSTEAQALSARSKRQLAGARGQVAGLSTKELFARSAMLTTAAMLREKYSYGEADRAGQRRDLRRRQVNALKQSGRFNETSDQVSADQGMEDTRS